MLSSRRSTSLLPLTLNPKVVGSTPTRPTMHFREASPKIRRGFLAFADRIVRCPQLVRHVSRTMGFAFGDVRTRREAGTRTLGAARCPREKGWPRGRSLGLR